MASGIGFALTGYRRPSKQFALPPWVARSLLLIVLAGYTAFSAGPFVWLASMSLRTTSEISARHYV
ncbi:MAG: hypothetical protein ACREYD_04000, partial [Casimicrobiaceae bacterium]